MLDELNDQPEYEVLESLANEGVYTGCSLVEESSTGNLKVMAKAGMNNFSQFLKTHPFLSTVGISMIASYLYNRKKNQRNITRFYAKTPYEKVLYKDIVDTLLSSGKFKKIRAQHIDGGILYELRRQ